MWITVLEYDEPRVDIWGVVFTCDQLFEDSYLVIIFLALLIIDYCDIFLWVCMKNVKEGYVPTLLYGDNLQTKLQPESSQ